MLAVLLICSFNQGKSSTGLATAQPAGLSVSWQEKRKASIRMGKIRDMVLNELLVSTDSEFESLHLLNKNLVME